MSTETPQMCARLVSERYSVWHTLLSMNGWMSRVIKDGYTLQFASPPSPFNGLLETVMSSQAGAEALMTELSEILVKEAISRVPSGQECKGYYSRYFLVPKKTGGMRPILDPSLFNKSIMRRPFHMLTISHVLECVRSGDWFASIDLKDAYFHVPIVPRHRKFLRFSFRGVQFQYNRLPFGYSLAPRTFAKCVETALEPLRRRGIRVLFYLDDLVIMASSERSAALHTVELASHLTLLGFAINWRKSSPVPTQSIMYLGVYLDSSSMRARLSFARREALASFLSRVTPGKTVTALSVMRLLGMMSAGHVVVPLGLLHMRKLQRWFSRLRLDPIRQKMPPGNSALLRSVGSDLLGKPSSFVRGSSPGQGDVARIGLHRRITVRMGRNVSGSGHRRKMARASNPTHQFSGVVHGAEGAETLRFPAERTACVSEDRQQDGSRLHQPTGRRPLGPG
ncbi:hypothetical protein F2P81_007565 [Scophthalmus maximus]|uniref:ribonuclease H n=1 Tax=Scophthalmus maximus TaxID=52904 RepID=A0A6A4T5S4_SCOMX|nr:hypothetical protein F2P81_007565 [Scophthalmus maximus]